MTSPSRQPRHSWVAATTLELTERLADQAHRNGHLTTISRLTVHILEVYCVRCRRTFARADEPCRLGPQHIGGPRRQPDELEAETVPGPE